MENLTDKQIEECITKAINGKYERYNFECFTPLQASIMAFVIERIGTNNGDISYMEYHHFRDVYDRIT